MTAQQIKDNTDLLIRQKTAQHSILKTEVAQQLDDIVDLIDVNISENEIAQTKVGSLTLGENLKHTADNWIALGTSITASGVYTNPVAKQLGLILNNFGASELSSNDLVNQYVNIPTLTPLNVDDYRLLSIEEGVNDNLQGVSIIDFKANLTNCILNAKSKGWANNKILIINSNYCDFLSMETTLIPYAEAAIEVAIAEGVQYVDTYNYTKNNGGGSLLSDGLHPSVDGGVVYARGITSLMNGGLEVTNALNVINGITSGEDATINGINVGTGGGNSTTNVSIGNLSLPDNTTGIANTSVGFRSLFKNTIGGSNTSYGFTSMVSNVSGNDNASFGVDSMNKNIDGNGNSSFGKLSLYNNVSGSYNTAIGAVTGWGITTGSNNTILGARVSGLAPNLSNNIILADGASNIKAQHDGADWSMTGNVFADSYKATSMPVFADNATALLGGLTVGQMYRTSTGVVMIVF